MLRSDMPRENFKFKSKANFGGMIRMLRSDAPPLYKESLIRSLRSAAGPAHTEDPDIVV